MTRFFSSLEGKAFLARGRWEASKKWPCVNPYMSYCTNHTYKAWNLTSDMIVVRYKQLLHFPFFAYFFQPCSIVEGGRCEACGAPGLGGKHDSTFSRSVKIGAHETTWCTFSFDKDSAKTFCARPHLKKYCWNPFVSFDTPKITCGIVLWSTLCISVHSVHICAYHRTRSYLAKESKRRLGKVQRTELVE